MIINTPKNTNELPHLLLLLHLLFLMKQLSCIKYICQQCNHVSEYFVSYFNIELS